MVSNFEGGDISPTAHLPSPKVETTRSLRILSCVCQDWVPFLLGSPNFYELLPGLGGVTVSLDTHIPLSGVDGLSTALFCP